MSSPGEGLRVLADPSAEQDVRGPFLVIRTDLLSGSQLIELPGAWSALLSLWTLAGGREPQPQAREEPGSERPARDQLLGTATWAQAAGSSRPQTCFPSSAQEQGPWWHLTPRVTGNQGHGPHSV